MAFAMTARPALAARAPVAARVSLRARAPAVAARRVVVVRAADPKSPVEEAIENAQEVCEGDSQGECAAAWDEVEELSAAVSHKKDAKKGSDPLEEFCEDNPDADECRVYED